MNKINEFDTIASIASPVSNSGIGIIRISGSEALPIIRRIFSPHNEKWKKRDLETYRIYYGNILENMGCEQEKIIDECIILVMKGPNSYTREDVVEIDCHGGVVVIKRILDLVIKQGARIAEPGEFTKRAFLNGRIDLSQAEAVMDLIESKNDMARQNSMDQLKGSLSERIRFLRESILYQIAYIESALDDPEHYDLDGFGESLNQKCHEWSQELDKLISSYSNGRMISEGIRTCIVGKPNAGKSSFLNALLGEDRAIVTEIAGTTRDTLEEYITIDGITLHLVDTAGIRDTQDKVESIGVERALLELEKADLVLFLMDRSGEISDEDISIIEQIRDKNKIVLLNKSDLDDQILSIDRIRRYFPDEVPILSISAKYSEGIGHFHEELKKMMFHGKMDLNDDIVITNERHRSLLEMSLHSIHNVVDSIYAAMPEDFYTIDLMDAYESLGKILGESVDDDLANEIFSRFCTGK